MTFKGMLRILINDYRKQHEVKMLSLVQELMKTKRELRDVKEQLHTLQVNDMPRPSSDNDILSVPMISLYVQYHGFFNQLHNIRQTMTIEELLVQLRQLTGIPADRSIRLRVLSEDGLITVFFLHKELHRTLLSYKDWLQPRMILSIEDNDDAQMTAPRKDRTHSFEASDV